MINLNFQRKEELNRDGEYRFIYKATKECLLECCSKLYNLVDFVIDKVQLSIQEEDIIKPNKRYKINNSVELGMYISKYLTRLSVCKWQGQYKGEEIIIVVNFEYEGIIFVTGKERIVEEIRGAIENKTSQDVK